VEPTLQNWGCEKSGVKMLHFPQPPVYAVTLPASDSQKSSFQPFLDDAFPAERCPALIPVISILNFIIKDVILL